MLKWTKCSPRTKLRPLKTGSTSVFRQEEAQTSPAEEDWGRLAPLDGRPTTLVGQWPSGPHHLNSSTMTNKVLGVKNIIFVSNYDFQIKGIFVILAKCKVLFTK